MRWEVGRTRERPCRDAGQYRACLFRDLEDNWSGLPQPHAFLNGTAGVNITTSVPLLSRRHSQLLSLGGFQHTIQSHGIKEPSNIRPT